MITTNGNSFSILKLKSSFLQLYLFRVLHVADNARRVSQTDDYGTSLISALFEGFYNGGL